MNDFILGKLNDSSDSLFVTANLFSQRRDQELYFNTVLHAFNKIIQDTKVLTSKIARQQLTQSKNLQICSLCYLSTGLDPLFWCIATSMISALKQA